MRYLDPAASAWCDGFFEAVRPAEGEAILEGIARLDLRWAELRGVPDLQASPMEGWTYWALFLTGFLRWQDGHGARPDPYVEYLVEDFGPAAHDLGIVEELADPERATARAVRRYRNCRLAREAAAEGPEAIDAMDPVTLITGDVPNGHPKVVVDGESREQRVVAGLDGYHRVFVARLFGLPRIPCRVVEQLAA